MPVKLRQTPALFRGKSTVGSENNISTLPEEQTKNKRQRGASCQPVNPISREDASTWSWVVNSQPDSLHQRAAMWFSELTAAKQNPSD